MSRAAALRVAVAELIGRPGARREVTGSIELADVVLEQTGTRAVPEASVDLAIETIVEGLAVTGTVHARWSGVCRRCLDPLKGELAPAVNEIFVDEPDEGETWPIEADHADLTPLVREAVMLALPLSPLCANDCAGPDPERFPTTAEGADDSDADDPPMDPRWAVLDELTFDD